VSDTERERLVARHMGLVHAIARQFIGLGEPLEDLVQEGIIGLLRAIDHFDPTRGIQFSTYASHLVTGQIRHALRDRGRTIRQPAWVRESIGRIEAAADDLRQELQRDPTIEEIAAASDLPPAQVRFLREVHIRNRLVEFDMPADPSDQSDTSGWLDKVPAPAPTGFSLEDRLLIRQVFARLPERQRQILVLRFTYELNHREAAVRLGISESHFSHILHGAIMTMRMRISQVTEMPEIPSHA
jgi:RNA polymerase sigma-B factor